MTTVATVRQQLEEAFSTTVRKEILNVKFHFVPVDVNIYRVVLGNYIRTEDDEDDPGQTASIENIVQQITDYVVKTHKNAPIILGNEPSMEALLTDPKRLPALVYRRVESVDTLVGVLYGSFNKTYDSLFKTFIRNTLVKYLKNANYDARIKEKLTAKAAGKTVAEGNIAKGFDIGHLAGAADYTISPFLEKLNQVDKVLNVLVGSTTGSQQAKIQEVLQEVQKAKASLFEKSTYASQISGYIEKDVSDFLVSVKAVLVVPQDALENRFFYGTKVEGILDDAVQRALRTVNFSRNLDEELEHRYISALQGIKVAAAKPRVDLGKIKRKAPKQLGTTNISAPTAGSIPKAPKAAASGYAGPVSLVSLQNLINTHLQDVISANMGNGDRKDVLNYRTGRLAGSAKVERMSQSRAGMITAFYSYMQNPYATFSDGGAQQNPKSRDPKLLIATAIREIAATKVANRMRAVLV